jgi:hypothetical protein
MADTTAADNEAANMTDIDCAPAATDIAPFLLLP